MKPPPRNRYQARLLAVQELEQRAAALRQTAAALEREQCWVQQQYAVLSACCKTLGCLRTFLVAQQQQQQQQQQQPPGDDSAAAGVAAVLAAAVEDLVLKELSCQTAGLPSRKPAGWALEAAAPDGAPFIAPDAGDPLLLFDAVLKQLPVPGAEALTLADLQASHMAMAAEVALALQQHDACAAIAPPPATQPASPPLERIRAAAMCFYARLMAFHLVPGSAGVARVYALTNCATGERQTLSSERLHWLVQHMQVSARQGRDVALGMELFTRLLEPLQQQIAQLQARIDCCCSTGAAEASEATSSGPVLAALSRIDEQQQLLVQLDAVMYKETVLKMLFLTFVVGRLSWLQWARMMVLAAPVNVHIGPLAQAIVDRWRQQQQEQQQGSVSMALTPLNDL